MLRFLLIAFFALPFAVSGHATANRQAATDTRFGELRTAPEEVLGGWTFAREECEEGETPSDKRPEMTIRFRPDFSYEFFIEGWTFSGMYRITQNRNSLLRIQLKDSLYNFDLVSDRLENWSEGDATYLCGRIFERAE